jgi:hypothetical protein
MSVDMARCAITVELEEPLSPGWEKVPGVTLDRSRVTIDPDKYFHRYESPAWKICDWEGVRRDLLPLAESSDEALEQTALNYIKEHGRTAEDAAEVLQTAEQVYSYLFRPECLDEPDLKAMGVNSAHLRMLREMGTMMALNRVDQDGHPSNVGPAWFFPVCSGKVYDLDDEETEFIDELYHGTFFNEARRVESVKAHAALGGRLVHGCQSMYNMAGGCVVPYGANVNTFTTELGGFKKEWIDVIRGF